MTINFIIRVTGQLPGVDLFIGPDTYLVFSRKKDALKCYDHLIEQFNIMYPGQEFGEHAVTLIESEVYDKPMFLVFGANENNVVEE